MSKSNKIIIAVLIIVVIIGGGLLLMSNKQQSSTSTTDNEEQSTSTPSSNEKVETVVFTYDTDGFSPSTATIKSGGTIKIVNKTDKEMEFASNPHPTHTDNPELNTGDIEPGQEKTVTITTKGAWGFHNHYDQTKGGTLTVE